MVHCLGRFLLGLTTPMPGDFHLNTRTPFRTALGLVVSVRGLCCLRGRGASVDERNSLITRAFCTIFSYGDTASHARVTTYTYIFTRKLYLTPHNAVAKKSAKCSKAYLTPYRKGARNA